MQFYYLDDHIGAVVKFAYLKYVDVGQVDPREVELLAVRTTWIRNRGQVEVDQTHHARRIIRRYYPCHPCRKVSQYYQTSAEIYRRIVAPIGTDRQIDSLYASNNYYKVYIYGSFCCLEKITRGTRTHAVWYVSVLGM